MFKHQPSKNQEGVTLLLTILVLSSILAISFSLATILFVEVRSSGDLVRSETSYYGAATVAEQALYNISRKVNGNPNNPNQCASSLPNCFSTSVGNSFIRNATSSAIADPIQQDTIPLASGLQTGQGGATVFAPNAKHYYLYDPACPAPLHASDPLINSKPHCRYGGSGYKKLILTYLSSGTNNHARIFLCEFDPTYTISSVSGSNSYTTVPCSDPLSSDGYWKSGFGGNTSPSLSDFWSGNSPYCWGSGCTTSPVGSLDPNKQQELIVFQDNSNINDPVYIQLQTYDTAGNPKGIPYFQQTGVDVTAGQGTVGRKLRVIVPNN